MRILDQYIIKPVISTFLGCLLIFIFLYIISDILGRLDEILRNHVNFIFIFQYYATYFPIIFTQTTPIAILLATIYTFGKLNRNNELIAMRSSGLTLWQLSATVLLTGIVLSMLIFFVNERFVPQAQGQAEKLKAHLEGNKTAAAKEEIIHNLTFYGLENRLFFVNSFDTKAHEMKGITILEHDEQQNLTAKIVAARAVHNDNAWIFYEFTKFYFGKDGQITGDTIYLDEHIMDITESPQNFLQQRTRPELMTITQLEDYIWRLKKSGASAVVKGLSVDLYARYASSLSCLILILTGIPFSFMIKRRANIFSSFGICVGVSFLFYVLNAISLALGKNGTLFPLMAAWLAPAVFSLFAIKTIIKTS